MGPSGVVSASASPRRADARFLLPGPARTTVALPGAKAWAEALDQLGANHPPERGQVPDLVVAPAAKGAEAARVGAPMVVLEGAGGLRALQAAGYHTRRWVPLPSLERPRVLVPVGHPAAARYAFRSWAGSDRLWKEARNAAAGTLIGHGAGAGVVSAVTIGSRRPGPPFLLAEAQAHGLPSSTTSLLGTGGADILSRAAFHVFVDAAQSPAWVLKFSRVRGYDQPFADDERGLALVAGAGGAVAHHAPRLVSRFQVDGYQASVETAAVGQPLDRFLSSSRTRSVKSAMVDRVASWALEVAVRTRAGSEALAEERRRLAEEVLPHWDVPGHVVRDLPDLPAVAQHNDLGCWNVVVRSGDFRVVDWESAVAHGLPLGDLLYFLTDALAWLDGAAEAGWERYVARLYRGELPSSATLFDWIRRAVQALGIPPSAVGPLATLCWLGHGMSHLYRQRTGSLYRAEVSGLPRAERVAAVWLSDPALGPSWDRWGP